MDNISIIKKNCTGCGLCRSACPKKCITLAEYPNNGHFYYPKIDERECILCGKCLANCPVYNLKPTTIIPPDTYLFYSQNKEILNNSTSGGAFGVLASYVLTNHGVVYGASWTNKLTVEHTRIDNIDNLFLLQKSKYIQSMINEDIYSQLKDDVFNTNKLVLFSGTPCQCAAVIKMFGNNKPNNLIVVDVICHGVPSQWLFNRWRTETEKQNKIVIKSFSFRVKKERCGVKNFSYSYLPKKGGTLRTVEGSPIFNLFLKDFYNELIFRESCYSCPFRGHRFFSDITLGDFWNLEKIDDSFLNSDNKSLLIINSELGKRIVEKIISDDNCILKKYPVEICLNNNSAYFNNPSRRNSLKNLKKWEKNSYFATYSLKIHLFKPYFVLKNLAKKLLRKETPLLFFDDFDV